MKHVENPICPGTVGRRWNPTVQRVFPLIRRRGSFAVKLLGSYFLIIFTWILVIFIVGAIYINQLILDESVKNNVKILDQFSTMADRYILGNMKDISVKIAEDVQDNAAIYQFMDNTLEKRIVDTLEVQTYLNDMLKLNPMIESISLYFPKCDLLVSSNLIRYTETEKYYMGSLLTRFRRLSEKKGDAGWYADSAYPVNSLSVQDGFSEIGAIHYERKLPSVARPGQTGCVLFITIRESLLHNLLQTDSMKDHGSLVMIDADGVIASHTDSSMIGEPAEKLEYARLLNGVGAQPESNLVQTSSGRRLLSVCRSADTGWIYVSAAPVGGLSTAGDLIFNMMKVTIALASAAAAVLSAVYARRLYDPIHSLVSTCRSWALPADDEGCSECQLIGSALNNLHTQVSRHRLLQQRSAALLKQEYMRSLFFGEGQPAQPISSWLDSIGVRFEYDAFCAWIAEPRESPCETENLREKLEGAAGRLEAGLCTDEEVCITTVSGDCILLLVNYDHMRLGISNLAAQISASLSDGGAPACRLSCGDVVFSIDRLREAAATAHRAEAYRFLFPELLAIRYSDIKSRELSDEQVDRSIQKNLAVYLKTQDHSKAMTAVDSLVSSLRESGCSLAQAEWELRMAAAMIEDAVGAAGFRMDELGGANVFERLSGAGDVFRYKKILLKTMDAYFQCLEKRHTERNQLLVNRAKAYIGENIRSTQLSLLSVAEYVGMSASHFSRIFKSETGVSFLEYVTDYKLDYCRRLLSTTNTKIETISGMLGYSTPQYFANRFKLKYGCTPKEYRCRIKS